MIYDISISLAYPDSRSDEISLVANGDEIKGFFGRELLDIVRECLRPGTYAQDGVEPLGLVLTAAWKDGP